MPQQLCLTSCGSDGNDTVRDSWLPPNMQCRCASPRLKPCCRCTACASAFRTLSTPSMRHQELALYSARLATASHGGQRQTERCAHCDGLWPVILSKITILLGVGPLYVHNVCTHSTQRNTHLRTTRLSNNRAHGCDGSVIVAAKLRSAFWSRMKPTFLVFGRSVSWTGRCL